MGSGEWDQGSSKGSPGVVGQEFWEEVSYEQPCSPVSTWSISPATGPVVFGTSAIGPAITEGTKHDNGKPGLHLLPPGPLEQISKVLDFGAKKYAAYNWTKGIYYSRVFSAALRHLWSWWRGEDTDGETGLSHLAHAGCCVLFLLQYEQTRRSFDDRPVKEYSNGTE